jgi:DNA-3-methyladenine glycosylase II
MQYQVPDILAEVIVATFELAARGPFDLRAATRFLEGFAPAGARGGDADRLRLAFPVDGDWRTAGVEVVAAGPGRVRAVTTGTADGGRVRAQVARILSLDVDGSGFPAVGAADPVVGRLQDRYPGLRPVSFWSPYEAAAWAVLSTRIRIVQAAALKQRIAEAAGEVVDVAGTAVTAFPAPARLLELDGLRGLPERKLSALHGIARAALDGRLDGAALRTADPEAALRSLQELPGIGPFSADLILLRGAGHPDRFPATERRLHAAMADAYGLGADPDLATLHRIADGWRPYRTWVSLLLRAWREDETGDIAGPRRPATATR